MGPSGPRPDTAGTAGTPRGGRAGPTPSRASCARPAAPETSPRARAGLPAAAAGLSRRAHALTDEPTHPDPGELIVQPSARSGVGAASRRGAAGARLGLRPRRAAAPARSPLARPCDPRLARTDAPESEPSCPLSPPSSLLLRQAPAGRFQSRQPPPPTLARGGGGGAARARGPGGEGRASAGFGAARAHWEGARPAPDTKGAERTAEAPEGSARPGAPLPAAGPSPRQRGAGLPLGGFLLCAAPPAPPHQAALPPPPWRGRLVSGSRVPQTPRAGRTRRSAVKGRGHRGRGLGPRGAAGLLDPFAWTPSPTYCNAPRERQHSHTTARTCQVVVVVVATKKV